MRAYLDGRKSGLFRPDPRQENTIKLLQALYDQLKQIHVDHKRPSGLTTTDHIGLEKPRHSWYVCLPTQSQPLTFGKSDMADSRCACGMTAQPRN